MKRGYKQIVHSMRQIFRTNKLQTAFITVKG